MGLVNELLADGQEEQAAGRQEGGRSWDLVVVLVVELFAGGREEQTASRRKEAGAGTW